mmetsp:Transcript_10010/g.15122  ORF Transcript_10010/g.15122 Transcript_10010/m.15122 type:complete len:607 (-) Transcript_10010:236-2056(-)
MDVVDILTDTVGLNSLEIESRIRGSSGVFKRNGIKATLQKESVRIAGKEQVIRRLYIRNATSGDYSNVGWVLNEDISNCMVCAQAFSVFAYRLHCHACGNAICGTCGSGMATVEEIADKGPVRVCVQCFWGQEPVCARYTRLEDSLLADATMRWSTPSASHTPPVQPVSAVPPRMQVERDGAPSPGPSEGSIDSTTPISTHISTKTPFESTTHSTVVSEKESMRGVKDERREVIREIVVRKSAASTITYKPSWDDQPPPPPSEADDSNGSTTLEKTPQESSSISPADSKITSSTAADTKVEGHTGSTTKTVVSNSSTATPPSVSSTAPTTSPQLSSGYRFTPIPVLVLKTKRETSGRKVFINILTLPEGVPDGVVIVGGVLLNGKRETEDKGGGMCDTYDVIIHPNDARYVTQSDKVAELVIEVISDQSDERLDVQFKKPKIKNNYKGLTVRDYPDHDLEPVTLNQDKKSERSNSTTKSRDIPPMHRGWLRKEGHMVRSWKERYFVLIAGDLSYYEKPIDIPPYGVKRKGGVSLIGAGVERGGRGSRDSHERASSISSRSHSGVFNRIYLYAPEGKDLKLEAQDEHQCDEWYQALSAHIAYASGSM